MRLLSVGLAAAILLALHSPGPGWTGETPGDSGVPAAGGSVAGGRAPVRVGAAFGRRPLAFEANEGQGETGVRFLTRGRGFTLNLAATDAALVLKPPRPRRGRTGEAARTGAGERLERLRSEEEAAALAATTVRMRFPGASAAPRVVGLDELPGKVNYYQGSDPSRWRTGIATYGRVRYEGVYPGIDLVFHASGEHLEYDFVVAPGADPGAIRLAFEGAEGVAVTAGGDLVVRAGTGELRHQKPLVYQATAAGTRQIIAGGYVLDGAGAVRFVVEGYDRSRPLVIDPTLVYSHFLGDVTPGNDSFEFGVGIAVNAEKQAYLAGASDYWSGTDATVAKLSSSGSTLLWVTYLIGSGFDEAWAIALDASGNAYATGYTTSSDFPTTGGAYKAFLSGSVDAFVVKLSASGTLVYSTYVGYSAGGPGETGYDYGFAIAVNSSGNAYVTGSVHASTFVTILDFPEGLPYIGTAWNFGKMWVFKLNSTGTTLLESVEVGPAASDTLGSGIKLDSSGNVYVSGSTGSSSFPTTAGAIQGGFGGGDRDAVVVKIDNEFTALVYATYLGGATSDFAIGLALDSSGSVYVTGYTNSAAFPSKTPIQPAPPAGLTDKTVFIAKLNPTGTALEYSTFLGGSLLDLGSDFAASIGWGIAVDSSGQAHVAGFTQAYDFPRTSGAIQSSLAGDWDAFVVKLDPTGTVLRYSTFLGGHGQDVALGIALDSTGDAYITGATSNRRSDTGAIVAADFPTTGPVTLPDGSVQSAYGGGTHDAIVAKLHDLAPALHFVTFPTAFPALPASGKVGTPYVGNIGIGGGTPPYTVTTISGALPAGLSFGSPVVSGTPEQTQTALFTAQVQDAVGTVVQQSFTVEIQPPTVPAPTGPAAGATSVSPMPAFTWSATTGATAYRIMIATSAAALPTTSGEDACPACVVNTTVTGASYIPLPGILAPGATYYWQVKAVVGTEPSVWSAVRSFSTRARLFTFTDDPLAAGTTPVRATHITQLRDAVNNRRANRGLAAFTFTDAALGAGTQIRALHLTELRSALEVAYAAAARTLTYAEPTVQAATTPIKASHWSELRTAVEALD
jgi:hypothetical protein